MSKALQLGHATTLKIRRRPSKTASTAVLSSLCAYGITQPMS